MYFFCFCCVFVIGFDVAKCAVQLLYGPVLVELESVSISSWSADLKDFSLVVVGWWTGHKVFIPSIVRGCRGWCWRKVWNTRTKTGDSLGTLKGILDELYVMYFFWFRGRPEMSAV